MESHDSEILAAEGPSVEATFGAAPTWQQAMKRAIRSGQKLCERLGISSELSALKAEQDFSVFAPLEYVARMKFGEPQDPLLLQVLASPAEMLGSDRALRDPVGDLKAQIAHGLLKKYQRRVLMITTGACAIHCRYCFRRHFPYDDIPKGREQWTSTLAEIAQDPTVDEVILSGGDPLTVSDTQLAWLFEELNSMEHIRRIRIHTRVPVVIPQRVCEPLLATLENSKAAVFIVLHFNHAAEIDPAVEWSISRLRSAGATLLNQAVLLKGVNDTQAAQLELCLRLINMQVLPYYLHQLDLVQGAMHFEVNDRRAREIINHLQENLPGYAIPRLVREIAGRASKTPL